MPRYGRDFNRSRYDEDTARGFGDSGHDGFAGRYGGMRSEGRRGGFSDDALDEMSRWGSRDDYDVDFGGRFEEDRYGRSAMGGYMSGGYGRGWEGRQERYLGGYERGFTGGRGWGGYGAARGYGDRGYETGEHRTGSHGVSRGGNGEELRRLRAADLMTENPECVTPDVSLADAARKMRDLDVGIIPVVEAEGSRRLRGVITDRDIAIRAVAEGRDVSSTRVSECMTTDVETCNKNDSVQNVLRVMEREQVRRVPITDREGRLVGIIAQADVVTELDEHGSEHRIANTLERISEPSHEIRGGMRAGQGRTGGPARNRTSLDRTGRPAESGGETETRSRPLEENL